jgi:hypothetical protein
MNISTQYLTNIRQVMEASLNLRQFPSQKVERQIHYEVEF